MFADVAQAGDDGVFEASFLLVLLELRFIGGDAGELQNVHAGHFGIHFFESAGFDERMNAFPRADAEMMLAMGANLEVFVEFLVEDHGAAFRTFGPQAFGNFPFLGFGGSEFWFFDESRVAVSRGRRDGGLSRFQPKRLL